MAVIGYARTSTLHQDAGLEAQLARLSAEGCEKIFSEQVSSVGQRAKLEAALEYVREDDTFVVTKLDRLARSVAHLVEIGATLERKGVTLKILDMGIDTGCPTGRLFLNIIGSIAQFEREIMLERSATASPRPRRPGSSRAVHRPHAARSRRSGGWSPRGSIRARLPGGWASRCARCSVFYTAPDPARPRPRKTETPLRRCFLLAAASAGNRLLGACLVPVLAAGPASGSPAAAAAAFPAPSRRCVYDTHTFRAGIA